MLDHGNGTEGQEIPSEYLREPSPATLAIFKVYKGCLLLLRPHVRTHEEMQYFNQLWSISEVLGTSRLPEAWKTFEALNIMMFMMSPENHAKFVNEDNQVAQILAAYTGAADFLMRWGPLVSDVQPEKGKDDYVMRQAANQRAIASLLRKRAEGLPLKFRHSKVAMMRLSDDLGVGVGVKPSSPNVSAASSPPVDL
ncbi:hypothetical protein N0V93_008034 [Gnomoniopsis smithogilvyi]|uniref:Uncharacterized protein n=1 Tax=Gnomoniopsis smithogilvyi TaxID=1191159 RepID=A0A9W8YL88_9PEZI|nr:hypothetical protein N0V93_008034 [Gnomoniopsis smithogilvyi]